MRLNHQVQGHNSALVPAVREVLMTAALEGIPVAIQAVRDDQRFTGSDAFVHTSYFSQIKVRKLILFHIGQNRSSVQMASECDDEELASWYTRHMATVQKRLVGFYDATGLRH